MLSRIKGVDQEEARDLVLKKFWIKVDGKHVFALPEDQTVRLAQLAPLDIVKHKPCKADLNPFLDDEYLIWLKQKREEQKHSGKYSTIWKRQGGRCAYCGNLMRPDQEVELVEEVIGKGRTIKNMIYIHKKCGFDVFDHSGDIWGEPIDLFELLDDYTTDAPLSNSPYLELRDFFRLCDRSPVTLRFKDIEEILGDRLPPEAYLYDAFWYENLSGMPSPLWRVEGYPFRILAADYANYCISDCWDSQGYEISALHRTEERIVFRRTLKHKIGWDIPKVLLDGKLPEKYVYGLVKTIKQYLSDNAIPRK